MSVSTAAWLVIVLALIGANLPFANQQLFAVLSVTRGEGYRKPIWMRLLEMLVLYALVGALGYLMETQIGNAFPQGWQFFAITGCLFLVLAFPGFAYQYLRKHQG